MYLRACRRGVGALADTHRPDVNLLATTWVVGQPGAMPTDEERADQDLAAAVERVRSDPEFMERLTRLIERDREILDRLAGDDHHERIDDASNSEASE